MSVESAKLAPQVQRREIKPQPGPQTVFLSTQADIAIYGGAAGGGKTFGLLMEPLRHISNPKFGAVVFRRTSVQVRNEGGLWDESVSLYPHVGGKPHEYDLWWKFPSGSSISFAHLEHDKNVLDWQGSQIALVCCEVGTKVRMGDGSLKEVEHLRVGDLVATLQGPREVKKVHSPREEDCVSTKVGGFQQVHAKSHKILSPKGWLSYDDLRSQAYRDRQGQDSEGVCSYDAVRKEASFPTSNLSFAFDGSTQHFDACKFALSSASKVPLRPELHGIRYQDLQLAQELSLSVLDRQSAQEIFVCTEQEALENDYGLSPEKYQGREQQLSSLHLQELLSLYPLSDLSHTASPSKVYRVPYDVPILSGEQGSQERCCVYTHPCDEHGAPSSSSDQDSVQLQVYVVEQSHKCLLEGEQGIIRRHSPPVPIGRYVHPYTGEERSSVAECRTVPCEMFPCGKRQVVHFAVEGENHYITESGLANKNCFDELTHFTAQQFWYMLSRNRSTCGIRPYVRATTNPDCESWVADLIEWWIDQDTGYPIPERAGVLRWFVRLGEKIIWADEPEDLGQYKNPMTGEAIPPKSLTFIPSLLSDNQILAKGDPGYLANLMALPLVERERLLNGNWKVRWQGQTFFALNAMLVDNRPVPYPEHCDGVFAVLDTASKTGSEHDGTAVIWCARSRFYGYPLVILDWDYVQISGALLEGWLPEIFKRGIELAAQAKARNGFVGAWVEDKNSGTILLQQAAKRSMKVRPINSKLTAIGKDERAFSVSGYVANGKVKLSEYAYKKTLLFKKTTKNHLISQIENFSIADETAKTRADDLLDAFVYCVALALGNHTGF